MAVLIPALGSCVHRMTSGEKRLAERLEQKLDDDYMFWYDVPVGPEQSYPGRVSLRACACMREVDPQEEELDEEGAR